MAYIVDLTCVMQILLLLVVVRDEEVSAEAVRVAMDAYEKTYRPNVHAEISEFPVNIATGPNRRDDVLHKIKELIDKYRIPDEDVMRFRRELQLVGVPVQPSEFTSLPLLVSSMRSLPLLGELD